MPATRRRWCLAKQNDRREMRDEPCPQALEVHSKSVFHIPDSFEYRMIHRPEDIVHEGLIQVNICGTDES